MRSYQGIRRYVNVFEEVASSRCLVVRISRGGRWLTRSWDPHRGWADIYIYIYVYIHVLLSVIFKLHAGGFPGGLPLPRTHRTGGRAGILGDPF